MLSPNVDVAGPAFHFDRGRCQREAGSLRGGNISGAFGVVYIGAGLKQAGTTRTETVRDEIGTAAGQRKAGWRICRNRIIGPDGGPKHLARRIVGAEPGVP